MREIANLKSTLAAANSKLTESARLAADSREQLGAIVGCDDSKPAANDRALQHLLNCLNAVTCKHRHGQMISKRRLDDLSNAQVEYEEASRAV